MAPFGPVWRARTLVAVSSEPGSRGRMSSDGGRANVPWLHARFRGSFPIFCFVRRSESPIASKTRANERVGTVERASVLAARPWEEDEVSSREFEKLRRTRPVHRPPSRPDSFTGSLLSLEVLSILNFGGV